MIFANVVEAQDDSSATNNMTTTDNSVDEECVFLAMIPFYLTASKLFSVMDVNKDGFISPDEFVSHHIDNVDEGIDVDTLKGIFDDLDSNADGEIDKMEFMSWQLKLYLRTHYEYCSVCQQYIERSETKGQQCSKSSTGHQFVEGKNERCNSCNTSTRRVPNLPYYNTCCICEEKELAISYQCLKCNKSICIQCEEQGDFKTAQSTSLMEHKEAVIENNNTDETEEDFSDLSDTECMRVPLLSDQNELYEVSEKEQLQIAISISKIEHTRKIVENTTITNLTEEQMISLPEEDQLQIALSNSLEKN